MRASGAEIIPFNTLTDCQLPLIDGLFIGGGFPERYASELQSNTKLRASIKTTIDNGLPTYAECGGLMYLSRKLNWQGKTFEMVGIIPADTTMHEKSRGRGYVKLEENSEISPWGLKHDSTTLIHAHEFHYSTLDGLPENSEFAYTVKRGSGINQKYDGLVYKNLLASYSHLRNTYSTPWVERFLSFVSNKKAANKSSKPLLANSS
jgi:cobyrinic acid a,c-diamide synthase